MVLIVLKWFRDEITPEHMENLQQLFQTFECLSQNHSIFLRDLEQRMQLWGSSNLHETHKIGDIMLKNMTVVPFYEEYIETHFEILERLNNLFDSDTEFQTLYREFEQQKICYLPINFILLKPFYRLLYYESTLKLLLNNCTDKVIEETDFEGALLILRKTCNEIHQVLRESENFVLLCEIQRDLYGFDSLVQRDRQIIRQGVLLKHSKTGLQQLIFLLFSDILIYANKSPVSQVFKILGRISLQMLEIEYGEHNTFTIINTAFGKQKLTVSALTSDEKILWLNELQNAVASVKTSAQDEAVVEAVQSYGKF